MNCSRPPRYDGFFWFGKNIKFSYFAVSARAGKNKNFLKNSIYAYHCDSVLAYGVGFYIAVAFAI